VPRTEGEGPTVPGGWHPTLHTERLLLRSLALTDLDALSALHAEPSFWWYPDKRGRTAAETESFLRRTVAHYDDPGFAVSAVVVRRTGELAGWAGLAIPTFLPQVLPAVEVGWRLGEDFRGHGYATEAGGAWLRHAFEDRHLDEVLSICEPENAASGAVMRRLGFDLVEETTHPTKDVALRVMRLTRDRWSAGAS